MKRSLKRVAPLLAVGALVATVAAPELGLRAVDGKAQATQMGQLQLPAVTGADGAATSSALPTPGAACTSGFAGPFPCENVDLLSVVPIPEIGAATGSDVWGWTDPESGREIAIPTTTFGMAFVDVTDPAAPVVLGRVYVGWEGSDDDTLWRDVKVHNDHAFLVSEHVDTNLTIFDLRTLRDVDSDQGILDPTYVYEDITDAHNIALNEETGIAYPVAGGECAAGMSMLDVNDPANIEFLGCVNDETLGLDPGTFDVVHDVQCVIYRGFDVDYQGHEICFASNEERGVFIVDVTDRDAPKLLSQRSYDRVSYAHQGWLTADHKYFVFGDETDELLGGHVTTATFTLDVTDLDNPSETMTWLHDTTAIDHNIYIEDGYVWQANYSAGLRVLDYTPESIAKGQFTQVAYFDVDPGEDAPVFAGAWTAYPFFDSGTIAVNTFDSGLFLLKANLPEKQVETAPFDPSAEPEVETDAGDNSIPAPDPAPSNAPLPTTGGGITLLGLVLAGGALAARRR